MNWALIILYFLAFVGILIHAYKHGEQQEDYNLFTRMIATIFELILIWWALGWRFI